jgi:hypothetical protein
VNERDPNSYADEASAGPQDRADDFTGPPVTAAEVALLQELAQMGANLARKAGVRAEAKQDAAALEANDAAAKAAENDANRETRTFEHMSRMFRLTLGLKAKLVIDLERWRRRVAEAAAEPAKDAERRRRAEMKRNVGDILNEVVGKAHGAKAAASVAQRLNRWFTERDYETQLPDLPLGALAARIARELGYTIVWGEWQDRDWAKAAEAASPPEAPFTIPEIQRVVIHTEDGGDTWVELGILQPDGTILPEAAPAPDHTSPPAQAPPTTRPP